MKPFKGKNTDCYFYVEDRFTYGRPSKWYVASGNYYLTAKEARKLAAWLLKAAEYCEGRNKK